MNTCVCVCLCVQVTGKAVMLDEIINYVQSLQRQVEVWNLKTMCNFLCFASCKLSLHLIFVCVFKQFLSMKLATVNPQMDFNLEGLLAKDVRDLSKGSYLSFSSHLINQTYILLQALQLRGGSSSAIPFPQNLSMVYPPLPHGFMQQTLSNIGRTTTSSPLSPMNGGFKRQVRPITSLVKWSNPGS